VIKAYQKFAPDAWFCQLTIMPWVYKRMYSRVFNELQFQVVARNFPPGGVYFGRNVRENVAENLPGK